MTGPAEDATRTTARLIGTLPFGKRLPDGVYLHASLLDLLPDELRARTAEAVRVASVTRDDFNVVKLGSDGRRVSLLSYPRFFEDPFPALDASWAIDLETAKVTSKRYGTGNPPILHRKETLLATDHPSFHAFAALTTHAEQLGLFENAAHIGTKTAWEARLRRIGVRAEDHVLVPADEEPEESDEVVHRHKTALIRYSLSTPMQLLWRHGFLEGLHTVFDYGCGRGDDLAALRGRSLTASGWDPHYAPNEEKTTADVVNLGFVLNVIEDLTERAHALRSAFSLANKVLAVAVLIGGRTVFERHRLYRDGVLTQRGTFQKYFTQAEIRDYLASTLAREPIALAPGVFFVFKDEEEEQRFLERRQRSYGVLGGLPNVPRQRQPRPVREPRAAKIKAPTKWEAHAELIEAFYQRALELARVPEPDEFARLGELRDAVGLPATVFNRLVRERGSADLEQARELRRRDLSVYLALNLFERRKSFGHLPDATRRDIKVIWGNYATAQTEAQRLLFSVGKVDVVHNACREAAAAGLGFLDGEHNLQVHASLTAALPAPLRVYLGCASRLYGEVDSADVVKVHIQSGKLSLMTFDDFESKALPRLVERVKIDMRKQDISFFEYGSERPQNLYMKSRFMHPSMEHYEAQKSFDQSLQDTDFFDFEGFGPPVVDFEAKLEVEGLVVKGFELKKRRKPAAKRPAS